MSTRTTLVALSCASAAAFSPVQLPVVSSAPAASSARAAVRCSEEGIFSADFSRRAALAGIAGGIIGLGATPSWAGYVTSLGIETTLPKDADRDDDLMSTKAVKDAIGNLMGYKSAASDLKTKFSSDTNMALIQSIRKDFDFSKVRDDLNIASTVFDDTTQVRAPRRERDRRRRRRAPSPLPHPLPAVPC